MLGTVTELIWAVNWCGATGEAVRERISGPRAEMTLGLMVARDCLV